jgi:hypothetical protein
MSRALTMSSFSNCPAACMSSTASAAKTCLRSAANTGEDGSSKPALQRLGTFTALSTRHHYKQKHAWPLRARAPACHRIRGGRRETNHATSLRSVHKVKDPLLARYVNAGCVPKTTAPGTRGRRRTATKPARPIPRLNSVAGSGTGASCRPPMRAWRASRISKGLNNDRFLNRVPSVASTRKKLLPLLSSRV